MNNIESFLIQLIASSAISSLLAGTLIWLGKSIISERLRNAISAEYNTKLETHKSQLQTITGLQIERAKSELALASKKQELAYSRLHEKRADVIADLFANLINLYDLMKSYASTGRDDKQYNERKIELATKHGEFYSYFRSNKIYLPKSTVDNIQKVADDMRLLFIKHFIFSDGPGSDTPDSGRILLEISSKLNNDTQKALEQIEETFRQLIGGIEA